MQPAFVLALLALSALREDTAQGQGPESAARARTLPAYETVAFATLIVAVQFGLGMLLSLLLTPQSTRLGWSLLWHTQHTYVRPEPYEDEHSPRNTVIDPRLLRDMCPSSSQQSTMSFGNAAY